MGVATIWRAVAPPGKTTFIVSEKYLNQRYGFLNYVYRSTDTIESVSKSFNVSIEDLLGFNGLTDENSIMAGQSIFLPGLRPIAIDLALGMGILSQERVFVVNYGSVEVSLSNWSLSDDEGNRYLFPNITLYEEGAVNVWTSLGTPTVVDLYWGLQAPILNPGDALTLRDEKNLIESIYYIP